MPAGGEDVQCAIVLRDRLGTDHDADVVAIDTDEGSWLSVDVSPDGKEIVFDRVRDNSNIEIIDVHKDIR